MKTTKIIFLLFLTFILWISTGCEQRKSLSSTDFKDRLENIGYSVQNVTDLYDVETNSSVSVALHSDYEILFHVLTNEESAKSFYTITKRQYKEEDKKSRKTENNKGSYEKFTSKGKQKYKVVIRVDKTVLLASTDKKHQKEIDEIVRKLGY